MTPLSLSLVLTLVLFSLRGGKLKDNLKLIAGGTQTLAVKVWRVS